MNLLRQYLEPLSKVVDSRIRRLTGTTAKIYVISLVTIPISTRLFGPEHFGILNTYVAILCVLLIPSMLKLEGAVAISRSLVGATFLARTSFAILCVYCLILVAGAAVLTYFDFGLAAEILQVIPFLPLGVFGAGMITLNAAFHTASDKAEEVNSLQYYQLLTTLIGQVVFGLMGLTKYGLLMADVIGRNVRTYWMSNCILAYELFGPVLTWKAIKAELAKHWRFPAFVMTGNLSRYTLSYAIPIVVFHAYSAEAAGYLAVAQRLTGLPRTVVGSAFNATLTSDWRSGHLLPGFLDNYRRISRLLLVILGVMIIAIAATMLTAAPLILGESWEDVGIIVCMLGGFYYLDAHLFSLTASLQVRGLQYVGLFSDVGCALAQLGCLIYASRMGFDFLSAVALVGATGAATLLVSEIAQYYALRRSL